MFALKEKHLFRAVNDENHIVFFKKYGDLIWNTLTSALSDYPAFQGLSAEHIYKIQVTRWLFAHGLAFQASNPPPGTWDTKTIISVMQDGSLAILDGLKNQFDSAEQTQAQ
jgi:hypothetical protein